MGTHPIFEADFDCLTEMDTLAETIGVPLSALKLVASLFAGYPLTFAHRWTLWGKSETLQHLYFATTGMGMIYWCYGKDLIHSFICTFVQWATMKTLGHSRLGLYFSFLFQFGYLLGGYYFTETEGYDICWTMPGCVMCLRLIGLAFDRFDGAKPKDQRRPDQIDRCLERSPSLLEVFGFSYAFPGLMIGPQYPLSHYRKFVRGELTDRKGHVPNSVSAGLQMGAMGVGLLGLNEVLKMYFPSSYMTTEKFLTGDSLLQRMAYISATGMALMYKYISTWTVVNGAVIVAGLGFAKTEEGVNWNALANIKLRKYWTARSFDDMIKCFNINTNDWVARYIFKRCRWMGSRYASHFTTLMFLAIWHGYHLAYFVMFALEFAVVNCEKEIFKFTSSVAPIQSLPPAIRNLASYLYLSSLWGFCVIEFSLLKKEWYMPVWSSIHYANWIFFVCGWLGLGMVNSLRSKPSSKTQ